MCIPNLFIWWNNGTWIASIHLQSVSQYVFVFAKFSTLKHLPVRKLSPSPFALWQVVSMCVCVGIETVLCRAESPVCLQELVCAGLETVFCRAQLPVCQQNLVYAGLEIVHALQNTVGSLSTESCVRRAWDSACSAENSRQSVYSSEIRTFDAASRQKL